MITADKAKELSNANKQSQLVGFVEREVTKAASKGAFSTFFVVDYLDDTLQTILYGLEAYGYKVHRKDCSSQMHYVFTVTWL